MLPTPSTALVSFDNVYEPAEDSFLFLDTLANEAEIKFLKQRFNTSLATSPLVLEVGSGSGVVLSFVACNARTLLGRADVLALATDINLFACKATTKTVDFNLRGASTSTACASGGFLGCVNGDLTSALRPGCVDVLLFNPPYVPSESVPTGDSCAWSVEEDTLTTDARFRRDNNLLAFATDGGADGMEVTNRLLTELRVTLNPIRGVAYVLLCAQNKPEKVKQDIRTWGPTWFVETVGRSGKQGGWESLQIVRIWREAAPGK